jgi:hypothetical protein
MTWYKHGTEFPDDCAEAVLSDAAFRTHVEAINYIYRQENFDLTVKKSTMRRWAGSDEAERATSELVAKGMWTDGKTEWTVVHHADVIRQSLAAQQKKLKYDKEYQQKKRGAVVNDVGNDDGTTQTDRQTDKQPREGSSSEQQIDWVTGEVFPSSGCSVCGEPLTTAVQQQNGICNRCLVNAKAEAARKAAS